MSDLAKNILKCRLDDERKNLVKHRKNSDKYREDLERSLKYETSVQTAIDELEEALGKL